MNSDLKFPPLRRTTIRQNSSIMRSAQEGLSNVLEQQLNRKLPTGGDQVGGCFVSTCSPRLGTIGKDLREPSSFDIIQRFRDSCSFEGPRFSWDLKAESTLLIILHWLYTVGVLIHALLSSQFLTLVFTTDKDWDQSIWNPQTNFCRDIC